MLKVVKFGGTSLADAGQIRKVAEIIRADAGRRYVVPSAPGKRFKEDTKVTDLLLKLYALYTTQEDYEPTLTKIKERYHSIQTELGLKNDLSAEFEAIEQQLAAGCSVDYIASRGEYLNGILLAEYLGYTFVDAAQVVCFNNEGLYDATRTIPRMRGMLAHIEHAVIPGFYGAMPDGSVKTFSRGGSDITGAIVAQAVEADLYENWTDVPGFLVCDPRLVESPVPIKVITYRELRELSYMGAGVLHPEAIFPVKEAGIPINIRSTNEPENPGTMIVAHERPGDVTDVITGIAGKKGFVVIRIEKDRMNEEIGFGYRVLKVIRDFGINFEHLPSSIDTMCVIVSEHDIKGREEQLLDAMVASVNPDYICMERGLALIAVVGRGMKSTKGTASRIFSAVAAADVNIRMIDQGSSELNIILGIREEDFERTINSIYDAFYK